jgi:hypothetical protein
MVYLGEKEEIMDHTIQDEVDRNFEYFQEMLPTIIRDHRGKHALMKDRKILGYYSSANDASIAASTFIRMDFSLSNMLLIHQLTLDSLTMPCQAFQYTPNIGPMLQLAIWKPGYQPTQTLPTVGAIPAPE